MDLLEYQAKELFRQVEIPVLPSQTIKYPRELKQLQIPYPVVLKSQVRVGGRGRAGGIRFVANTIDAIAAARTIFNLSILGEYPEVLLAEARYDAQREFFLAIVLDYQLQRPVLLGSAQGGINIEPLLDNLQQVVIETDFSLFYARRLTLKMGLSGELIQSVSAVIEKMYRLFQAKDLDLIEINPLGVSGTNELMALDGKITVNDYALARNPDILALTTANFPSRSPKIVAKSSLSLAAKNLVGAASLSSQQVTKQQDLSKAISSDKSSFQWLDWTEAKGNIAIICNNLNLAIITWDLICQSKGRPICCGVIDDNSLSEQLPKALAELESMQTIKAVLINILAEAEVNQKVAELLADYFRPIQEQAIKTTADDSVKSVSSSSPHQQVIPQFVLRLFDYSFACLPQPLLAEQVYGTENLEEAVSKAIALTKSK